MIISLKKKIEQNLIFFITLIAAVFVYFSFIKFGHISWDDPEMVFKNKFVKSFDFRGLISNHFVGNYIPITMLVHALNWLFFGSNNAGHHLINIIFHLINGILVYQLTKQLFQNKSIGVFTMIIFLLHPLQVESVGWISELKNILSTTFYLSGIMAYFRYLSSQAKRYYLITLLSFIFGCLSKSSVVVLPLSLLCIDVFFHQKISWKFLIDKIPFFLLSIGFGLLNIKTQTADQFINYSHDFPFYQKLGYAGFALIKYLLMFVAPINLSVIYPYPQNANLAFVIGYGILVALIFIFYRSLKNKKLTVFSLMLFTLVNLILVLQFVPFGEVLYADRYMYVPIIGLAWISASFLNKINFRPRLLSLVLIGLLSVSAYSRSKVWESGITLYEDILKNFPNSFVALNSIGVEYMLKNNNQKALYYLNKSIAVAPYNYKGFYNRGLFYLKNLKAQAAVESFNRSLEIYEYGKAYVGRASAYHMLGEISKSMADARSALLIDNANSKAHFVLGNCYNDLNRLDSAMFEYNTCISLNTDEADFYFKRGIVYGKTQDFRNCISDINTCLSLDPAYYEAYYWRGVAMVNLNQNACADFKIAANHNYQPAVNAFKKYCQ